MLLGLPCFKITPSFINKILLQTDKKLILCETIIIVFFPLYFFMVFAIILVECLSKELVGSSNIRISGSLNNSLAITILCFCPLNNFYLLRRHFFPFSHISFLYQLTSYRTLFLLFHFFLLKVQKKLILSDNEP